MKWMTFHEYVQKRQHEGLWVADNRAIEGISGLPKAKPPKKSNAPATPAVQTAKPASPLPTQRSRKATGNIAPALPRTQSPRAGLAATP